jgi:hypothetical protein
MVPVDFVTFFSTMAGVGATLFGLIFLVISIKPETTQAQAEKTSVIRQVQIASAYNALLNPLVISLFAIVPHATIGNITLIMGVIGLVSTITMGISLLEDSRGWATKLKNVFFILSSIVIFGFETFYARQLIITPGALFALANLTTLLVIIYLYGIARAWDLIGARQFHIKEVFTPLLPKRIRGIISDTSPTESTQDAHKQKD